VQYLTMMCVVFILCTHVALVTAVPFGYTLLKSAVKPQSPVTVETLVSITIVSTVAQSMHLYIYYENRTRSTRNKTKKEKKVQKGAKC